MWFDWATDRMEALALAAACIAQGGYLFSEIARRRRSRQIARDMAAAIRAQGERDQIRAGAWDSSGVAHAAEVLNITFDRFKMTQEELQAFWDGLEDVLVRQRLAPIALRTDLVHPAGWTAPAEPLGPCLPCQANTEPAIWNWAVADVRRRGPHTCKGLRGYTPPPWRPIDAISKADAVKLREEYSRIQFPDVPAEPARHVCSCAASHVGPCKPSRAERKP